MVNDTNDLRQECCRRYGSKAMKKKCYLRPAWTDNGSVRTDLPLTVIGKKRKAMIETITPGQLLCVGKVYLKTQNGLVRIR